MEEEKKSPDDVIPQAETSNRTLNAAQGNQGDSDNTVNDVAPPDAAGLVEMDKFRAERASRASSQRSSSSGSSSTQCRGKGRPHASVASNSGSQPGAFAVAGMSQDDTAQVTSTLHNEGTEAIGDFSNRQEQESTQVIRSFEEIATQQEQPVESAPVVRAPVDESSNSVYQDNERLAPMVEAELVSPPVEALKVVFDEDQDDGDVEAHRDHSAESTMQSPADLQKSRPRKRMILWGVAILAVVLAVVIPLSIVFKQDQADERTTDSSGDDDDTNAPLPTFPYECYWTNYEMIGAQLGNPDQRQFVMCPGMHTKIGTMEDPANGNTNITNGDLMMMILRDNVEIRCGEDGRVENNCVLDGGFLQVLMQSANNNENGLPGFAGAVGIFWEAWLSRLVSITTNASRYPGALQ